MSTLLSLDVGYSKDELASIPADANLGLGSGHPTAAADLQEGETVLDLGSGGGMDCFLASLRVGDSGRVIGVDMTPEMVSRASRNASEGGYGNVEFRLGEVEALPVADGSVDVVISNCVLNLSPRRQQAFDEAFRVLKPGGRLVISDLIAGEPVPKLLRDNPEIASGCLPVSESEYLDGLQRAGFTNVQILEERPLAIDKLPFDESLLRKIEEAGPDLGALVSYGQSARSAIVRAEKR
jgi:SAM-dependent methyltransferase